MQRKFSQNSTHVVADPPEKGFPNVRTAYLDVCDPSEKLDFMEAANTSMSNNNNHINKDNDGNDICCNTLFEGDCATPDVLMASAASVLEIYYGGGGLRKSSMTDFGKFAGELADELGKRDSPQVREREGERDGEREREMGRKYEHGALLPWRLLLPLLLSLCDGG